MRARALIAAAVIALIGFSTSNVGAGASSLRSRASPSGYGSCTWSTPPEAAPTPRRGPPDKSAEVVAQALRALVADLPQARVQAGGPAFSVAFVEGPCPDLAASAKP